MDLNENAVMAAREEIMKILDKLDPDTQLQVVGVSAMMLLRKQETTTRAMIAQEFITRCMDKVMDEAEAEAS